MATPASAARSGRGPWSVVRRAAGRTGPRCTRAALALAALTWLSTPVAGASPADELDIDRALEETRTLLQTRGRYEEVVSRLTRLAERTDLTPLQRARLHTTLAVAQVETGQYAAGLRSADVADALARRVGADDVLTVVETARGTAWRHQGQPLRALDHYHRGLSLAEQSGDAAQQAAVYAQLAAAHQDLGDWNRVLYYLDRGFATRSAPTPRDRFNHLMQRGIAHYEFNDRDGAFRDFSEGLVIAEEIENPREISFALGELGLVAWEFDRDWASALDYFDRAIAAAREAGVPSLEANWLLNAGSALRDAGDLQGALRRYQSGLAIERRLGQRRIAGLFLKNMGQVLHDLGRRDEAERLLLEALVEADASNRMPSRWQTRMELGRLYADGRPELADRYYSESLDVLEQLHANVLLENFRAGAIERSLERYDPYDLYVEFLIARGDTAGAFRVAERARARIFLETLASAREELARVVPQTYREAENDLLRRISERQAALRAGTLDERARSAAVADVESAEEELRRLRVRLAAEHPAVADVRFPGLVSLDALRAELASDETLLLYFVGRRQSWSWIVSRDAVALAGLPGRQVLERAAVDHLRHLKSPGAGGPGESDLSRALAPDVVKHAARGSRLIVVAHGMLHYVPFETLRDDEGRYFVERYVVSYAPSASTFSHLRRTTRLPPDEHRIVAVGNPRTAERGAATERQFRPEWAGLLEPLPHSGDELRHVAALFPRRARLLEQNDATEAALADLVAEGVGILHFATHGLIDEQRPERSGLAMTASPPDDGILQAREVYRLHLPGALVTLSACDSALGRHVTGEGLIGLTRPFFYAGASTVVASLWSVNDAAAAHFMRRFYEGIRRGEAVDFALQRAKRSFLSGDERLRHPYYWAPFIAMGRAQVAMDDASDQWQPPRTVVWLTLLALAGSVALVIGRVSQRRRAGARTG